MLSFGGHRIFLVTGATDMGKSFNGLASLASSLLRATPEARDLFVFANRSRTGIKILLYDDSGAWVFAKRLNKGSFTWPDGAFGDSVEYRWGTSVPKARFESRGGEWERVVVRVRRIEGAEEGSSSLGGDSLRDQTGPPRRFRQAGASGETTASRHPPWGSDRTPTGSVPILQFSWCGSSRSGNQAVPFGGIQPEEG